MANRDEIRYDVAILPEVERALQSEGKDAGRLLAAFGSGTAVSRQKDDESDEDFARRKERFSRARATIREAVKNNPGTAIAVVAKPGEETGLSLTGKARALDEIIGQIGNDDRAVDMIDEHIMRTEQHKLLVERGDLPSSFAELATPEQVIQAALANVAEIAGREMITAAFELQAWAWKLKDRDDFKQILDTDLSEYGIDSTFRDQVLCAIYVQSRISNSFGVTQDLAEYEDSGWPEDEDEEDLLDLPAEEDPEELEEYIDRDMFEMVGIDWETGFERLHEMQALGGLPYFDAERVTEVLAIRMRARKSREQAANLTESAQAELQELGDSDDLDF